MSKKPNFTALMSVPRVGWIETFGCLNRASRDLGFESVIVQGVFWGHCIENGLEEILRRGQSKYALVADYDSVFDTDDILKLHEIIEADPTIDAICPYQVQRESNCLIVTKDEEEAGSTYRDGVFDIKTGHFGLTLVRLSALDRLPRPLFHSTPDASGGWREGKTCDDIYFWDQMRQYSRRICMTDKVRIGHLQLFITWPLQKGPMHQYIQAYHQYGRPQETKVVQ